MDKIARAMNKENSNSLEKFLYSLSVISFLRDRAWLSASFIEYIILSCTQIDAMLRMGIILKEQMINRTSDISEKWLVKNYKERDIFRKAEELKIINGSFSKQLHLLYDGRNAVVHRFIITDVEYEYSKRLASEFEPNIFKLNKILEKIEKEQIAKKVGMTVLGKEVPVEQKKKEVDNLQQFFMKKMGNDLEKINSVRSHKWPDVEDIVEFASRKGYTKECKTCKHIKALHIKNEEKVGIIDSECQSNHCDCVEFK